MHVRTKVRMCVRLYVQFTYGAICVCLCVSLKRRFSVKKIRLITREIDTVNERDICLVENCRDINFQPHTVVLATFVAVDSASIVCILTPPKDASRH